MARLCERPGCSEVAAVAYGMHVENLVFWLEAIDGGPDPDVGALCQRHADSITVPRGWTLDDRRDPDLHLFRPPKPEPSDRTRSRRPTRDQAEAEQLELDGVEAPEPEPWRPEFDGDDDLNGLLAADSPLLSRAFRGTDRT